MSQIVVEILRYIIKKAGFIIYLLLWLCATNGGPTKLYIDAAIYRLKCKDKYNTVSRSEGSDDQNLHQSK